MHIDFYYDIVCPYAYLASTQIESLAQRCGVSVNWHPVLLGGIFRTVGQAQVPMQKMSVPKARLNILDLHRWADVWGCELNFPAEHPRRTVNAMRLLVATPPHQRPALSMRLYKAYWQEGLDVSDRAVLDRLAREFGLDGAVIDSPSARDGLFETTAAAVKHGAFGVPAIVVDGRLFWGQDRLHFVEKALGGQRPELPSSSTMNRLQTLRFYHDFASPFSYLAATQIERVARENGAKVQWVPILLGGLFRDIETPDVPLFSMPPAKRAYIEQDLIDWAEWHGVNYQFPDHFPLRTVLACRVAIVAPETTPIFYRAAWSDNRAIGDIDSVRQLLIDHDFDADRILSEAQSPEAKKALRDNTELARQAGACGVPTFEILSEDGQPSFLIWGQDRLDLLAHALRGWRPQRNETK